MLKGFKNCNIYVGNCGIVKTSLTIENGRIKQIGDIEAFDGIELKEELFVIPGFVDRHIHGANHSDFMNPTRQDIDNILTKLPCEGTTSCLATTMTQSLDKIEASLANIGAYIEENPVGTQILGIHLEGPFISKKVSGAQPIEYIIPCDIEQFKKFNLVSKNHIKEVSLACEENGIPLIRYLNKNQICASLGHCYGSYDDVALAVENGATSVTHTYNAMKPLHHRDIGVVGAALLEPKLNCELICDLIHVSKPAVKLLYRNKGISGISLITDSIESKYMPDGKYQLGGQDVFVQNNEARLADGTLAGSTLKMNEAVRNFMNATGVSFTQAIDCATINPARCIHKDDIKGSIEVGKDADFVVVDKEFNVYMTICRGHIIYKR